MTVATAPPLPQAALPGFADLTLAVLSQLADDLRSVRQRKDALVAIADGAHLWWLHQLDVPGTVVEHLAEYYEALAQDAAARPRAVRRYSGPR